jgi:hypothetical protein
VALAGLLLCLAAAPSYAQGLAGANLAVSSALLSDSLADATLPAGWVVTGAYGRGRVAGVAEAGGHYKSQDNGGEIRVHAFLGGVRVSRRPGAAPFAQMLVGVACYCGTSLTLGERSNRWALQPGAGMDLSLSQRWAVRLQGDYRWISGDGADGSRQLRLSAGLVVRFPE